MINEKTKNSESFTYGFPLGLIPEKIIDMKFNTRGNQYFLVKWRGVEDCSYVKAEIAKRHCMMLILEYYQENLRFIDWIVAKYTTILSVTDNLSGFWYLYLQYVYYI